MTDQELYDFYNDYNKVYLANKTIDLTPIVLEAGLKSRAYHRIIIKQFHKIKHNWNNYSIKERQSADFLYKTIRGERNAVDILTRKILTDRITKYDTHATRVLKERIRRLEQEIKALEIKLKTRDERVKQGKTWIKERQ